MRPAFPRQQRTRFRTRGQKEWETESISATREGETRQRALGNCHEQQPEGVLPPIWDGYPRGVSKHTEPIFTVVAAAHGGGGGGVLLQTKALSAKRTLAAAAASAVAATSFLLLLLLLLPFPLESQFGEGASVGGHFKLL